MCFADIVTDTSKQYFLPSILPRALWAKLTMIKSIWMRFAGPLFPTQIAENLNREHSHVRPLQSENLLVRATARTWVSYCLVPKGFNHVWERPIANIGDSRYK